MEVSYSYNSFFTDMIVDNNGVAVCDVNKGLARLYEYYNEHDIAYQGVSRHIIGAHEEGYPDLVAMNSSYGGSAFWWWLLFFTRQEDPFVDTKENYIYTTRSPEQVTTFITNVNKGEENTNSNRIGKIVDLN